MSYGTSVYYNPEKYGLEIIGEVDFSDGCWQFDSLVVWRRIEDGQLFYGEDSGCSCPSPFEDVADVHGLVTATPHEIAKRIGERQVDNAALSWRGNYGQQEGTDLISKVMSL